MEKQKKGFRPRMERAFGSWGVFTTYCVCMTIMALTVVGTTLQWILWDGEYEFEISIFQISMVVLGMLLMTLPPLFQHWLDVRVPKIIHILIVFHIVAHFVGGGIMGFYDHHFWFDKLLHFNGGAVKAIIGFSVVNGLVKSRKNKVQMGAVTQALFAFMFALSLILIWEFFEFAMDMIVGSNMLRWQDGLYSLEKIYVPGLGYWYLSNVAMGSGLLDTMWDMIFGSAAALVVCVIGFLWLHKNPGGYVFPIFNREAYKKCLECGTGKATLLGLARKDCDRDCENCDLRPNTFEDFEEPEAEEAEEPTEQSSTGE